MKKGKKEGNTYDKILKENLEAILEPLLPRLLNLDIVETKILDAKLQSTTERETDSLRLVKTRTGEEFILHLEFQSQNDAQMIYRIGEYQAMIQRKFRKSVRSFVIFLGAHKMTMRTKLKSEEVYSGFEVLQIAKLDFEQFLSSQIPEEILLAILADRKEQSSEQIIRAIVSKLRQVSDSPANLKRFITQLNVLGRLRNLDETINQTISDMPITYDYTKDFLFKKGIEIGIRNLIKTQNFTFEQIAEFYEVDVKVILKVKAKMDQESNTN